MKRYRNNIPITPTALNTTMPVLFAFFLGMGTINAQTCTAHFEVNAGPGIDVCDDGQVNLNGRIGGDATAAVWRGGKGKFDPDRNALDAHYLPDASEAGTTVILMLVANNPAMPDCPPVRDEIKISVNQTVKANAGANISSCGGAPVQLNGKVQGTAKESIWYTRGSGKFDNPYHLNAVYTPSDDDIKKQGTSLYLVAIPFGQCQPDTATISMALKRTPVLTTEPALTITAHQSANLSAIPDMSDATLHWSSNGSGKFSNTDQIKTVYTPSNDDVKKGTITITVTATAADSPCSSNKDIQLTIKQQ